MASQECVAVLQRMLDDVRGIGRVCATNVIYAAGEQEAALTAAIDALQRQGEVVAALDRLDKSACNGDCSHYPEDFDTVRAAIGPPR